MGLANGAPGALIRRGPGKVAIQINAPKQGDYDPIARASLALTRWLLPDSNQCPETRGLRRDLTAAKTNGLVDLTFKSMPRNKGITTYSNKHPHNRFFL